MVYWHLPRGRFGFGENTYVAWRIPPFGGEPQSASTVLFWLVPILYPFEWIPKKHIPLYELNPVAARVMSLRRILLAGQSADRCDAGQTGRGIGRLFLFGLLVFRRLKPMFYERI